MASTLKPYALEMLDAGLCVMPPMDDGSKRPFAKWKEYQKRLPTEKEVSTWYANGKGSIGLLTGQVSGGIEGGLECLDFDDKAIFAAFVERAAVAGLALLVSRIVAGYREESPNGVHLLYYCAEVGGNTKLANRADKKAIIETRGEGGFVVVAPTTWPGKQYRVTSGGIATIATITPQERQELFHLAQTFNEVARQIEPPKPQTSSVPGDRPGDDFCNRASWTDILPPHGWRECFRVGDVTHWGRPGKSFGVSATTNHADSDLLYVFSTSTVFDSERGYNKFSAYALLNHGGDFEAAGRELRRQGYGAETVVEPPQWTQEPIKEQTHTVTAIKTFAQVAAATFEPIRWIVPELIPEGCIILAGSPKIGKSWLATELCLCAASNGKRPFLGKYVLPHHGALYLALEDSDRRMNDRINKLISQLPVWSGHHTPAPTEVSYATSWPILGKGCIEQITAHLDANPDCKLVIVDTLQKVKPQAAKNMTAYEIDYAIVAAFQEIAIKRGITIILITHLRKSTGAANEDPFEQITGSMGISGAADASIVLHKGKASNIAELYVRGRDVEEQSITIKMENCCWQYLGTGQESEGRKYLAEIKEFAQEWNRPDFKPADFNRWFKEGNGYEIKGIRVVFQRLFEDGFLGKKEAGRFYLEQKRR